MIICKVTGSVVSTRKNDRLRGSKFMIVKPFVSEIEGLDVYTPLYNAAGELVAVDNVGAGIGEYVLVTTGSAARIGCDMENSPIDAAIVGIIDDGGIMRGGREA